MPVFIDWPKGSKGTKKKWGSLTIKDMTPTYVANLREGNIGVALGEVSSGLCAIDADTDEFAASFRTANPALANTLQTHGARGCVFWVRLKGNYPRKTTHLRTYSGQEVGEFRSNGSQSIIFGIHPVTQKPYKIVNKQPVVEIGFDRIVWPGIANPPTCTEEDGRDLLLSSVSSVAGSIGVHPTGTIVPSTQSSLSNPSSVSSVLLKDRLKVRTMEDVLRRSVPTEKEANHDHLFDLARGVKTLERDEGKYTNRQLRNAFDQWHARSTQFHRPGRTKEAYWLEFVSLYEHAKFPFSDKAILQAWETAKNEPPPPEALQFESAEIRRLVALCFQLQKLNVNGPFFLASRTCQYLFGHVSHSIAARWLVALRRLGIIEEIRKGDRRWASRYRYINASNQSESVQTARPTATVDSKSPPAISESSDRAAELNGKEIPNIPPAVGPAPATPEAPLPSLPAPLAPPVQKAPVTATNPPCPGGIRISDPRADEEGERYK